jgi:predicted glutamine amidotransferase
VRAFHDVDASANSRIAEVVQTHPIKSEVALCHIRQANVGEICLANTHPFMRELWGRYWVFAHNGQLSDHSDRHSTEQDTVDQLVQLSAAYARQGVFNLLLSNGDWLFTFCSTKMASITRRAPFGPARLKDTDVTIDFEAETTPNDIVSVVVTEPLTSDEQWDVYQPGEWRLWRKGEVIQSGVAALAKIDSAPTQAFIES